MPCCNPPTCSSIGGASDEFPGCWVILLEVPRPSFSSSGYSSVGAHCGQILSLHTLHAFHVSLCGELGCSSSRRCCSRADMGHRDLRSQGKTHYTSRLDQNSLPSRFSSHRSSLWPPSTELGHLPTTCYGSLRSISRALWPVPFRH